MKGDDDHYETIEASQVLSSSTFLLPFGINNSDAVAGSEFSATAAVAFIRTCDGIFKLVNDTAYPDQTYVTGINDHYVLVGDVYDPTTGASPAFIAYPQK